jgi:hypothetical protein
MRMMVALWLALGIVIAPACSKKPGDDGKSAGQPALTDKAEKKPLTLQEKRQEMLKQLQQIRGELIIMQGATLKKYPELSDEQGALKNLIEEKMTSLLVEKDVDLQQLQLLQKKLQDPDLPQEEKTTLMQEFQTKAKLARQARVDAMNDQAVKDVYQQYETHLKEKLIADHPNALEKMEAFDKIQASLQTLEANAGVGPAN